MSDTLCSVGLDVGTSTTQFIVSKIRIQNRASSFAVPQLEITDRKVVYESPVHFTPLLDASHVDGEALRRLVAAEYQKAGITPKDVDTGAVIITGETSRKENAKTVLESMADLAGEFVVATAGPDLESILAAKGAGAVEWSEKTGKRVLHIDIGGGTSNMAWIEGGQVMQTSCMNVGGRLIKLREGQITYISPVLEGLTTLQVGDKPELSQLQAVAELLTGALEMAAGLREKTEVFHRLVTREALGTWTYPGGGVLSFSGGVADCIERKQPPLAFGDIGPLLGQGIRNSRLCREEYMLGRQTIRATVIGAGCHSAQLSGSTVFCRDVALPLKNLPVAVFDHEQQEDPAYIRARLQREDTDNVVIAIPGYRAPTYEQVQKLARVVATAAGKTVLVALEHDMAKALGHSLCLQLSPGTPCLCIDRVKLQEGSYLDVGQPVGPCLPVVIKTLILSQ